jgi:hexosaminidase
MIGTFLGCTEAGGQSVDLSLLPMPLHVKQTGEHFRLTVQFSVSVRGAPGQRVFREASRLLRRLDNRVGFFFRQGHVTEKDREIGAHLVIEVERPARVALGEDESYRLHAGRDGIRITAATDLGAIRGMETLLQTLSVDAEGYYFPGLEIEDAPRFPWRGLLIDVCLHWMPMEVIKRTLDCMASVKMNVLHLHLSEDQAFAVESRVFPRLHQVASGGNYFTQEDIGEIVAYADQRGIRIVPEFDVPGHATSMMVAYPELASVPREYELQKYFGIFDPALDVTKPYTYTFLDKLFGEMSSLFPDEYFHIGGDENTGKDWERSPHVRAYMEKRGMKSFMELQTEFNQKILKILQKYGKRVMGWDEILQPGVPRDIMIQSWRGNESLNEAARNGYYGLLSSGYYIDLIQPTDFHYLNDPVPADSGLTPEEQERIVGGEATMWTEHVTPETVDSRIWPRTAAIAERLWSPRDVRDVSSMYERLKAVSLRLEDLGSTHLRNKQALMRRLANGYETSPLETLVDVIEPLKIYQRNAGDTLYTVFSPYTMIADVATPDQEVARRFRVLVDRYVKAPNSTDALEIGYWLDRWRRNREPFAGLVRRSPVLAEALVLSENLAIVSEVGLEALAAIQDNKVLSSAWRKGSLTKTTAATEQGGRCDLQVVSAIEVLVRRASEP